MRKTIFATFLAGTFVLAHGAFSAEPAISIRLESCTERGAAKAFRPLFSLPPEEWCARYKSESIVYVPGEKARFTVEVSPGQEAPDAEIALAFLISGRTRVLYHGPLNPGTYGPYGTPIVAGFEVYQVRVRAGDNTVTRGFYGIRPWRGMKDFSEEMPPREISLSYENTTPWDLALKEETLPLNALDVNWTRASHIGHPGLNWDGWWLWTHYGCGMVTVAEGRTGLLWGEYNPWTYRELKRSQHPAFSSRADARDLLSRAGGLETEAILPCGIYFRERMQPLLRTWAKSLSEKHPNEPLRISLGDDWDIARDIGRRFGPETLRYFVPWMKEQFGIVIEADTFKELIRKCEQYPKHFQYFLARNTAIRSLQLTCEAVQDIVADSKAWCKSGESNRQLIALPEAGEFCQILSRCIGIGTSDDERAWHLTHGNPLPHSLSNMVLKAFAPDHNFCVGWNGCVQNATAGEIYRWYLEPAWITAYDAEGKIHHLYTHSPPTGTEGVWHSLIEVAHAPDEKIRLHDKCFQLMEAEDVTLLQRWAAEWLDLCEFEIVPVTAGKDVAAALAGQL